jgi:hypothetical protein
MSNKIILLITLLAYSIIVSQSFMYILALKDVQLKLEFNTYTEIRKLIDLSMRANFKYAIYAALLGNLLLVMSNIKNPSSLIFITSTISLIALIADIFLTLKGSLPINDMINTWSSDNYPKNWSEIRMQWFNIFQYRQIANITGWISLLIGAVFGSK